MNPAASKSFRAPLEPGGPPLHWTIVRLPFDAAKVWGKRGQLRVRGEINGFAFRACLFPTGGGGHFLMVNKKVQKAAGAMPGDVAKFRLQPDTEERVVSIPPQLERYFSEERRLRRWYDGLNHSTRWEIARWITEVENAGARERRAEQMAERLMATMEAERDLPPVIRLALARNPQADKGWKRMSAARRRGHLMGVFYYRTPAAQARRVAKLVADARQLAEKGSEADE